MSSSPENHALEAYELYLGLFETEEDSLRGGIACKDLYLTPDGRWHLHERWTNDWLHIGPTLARRWFEGYEASMPAGAFPAAWIPSPTARE